MQTRNVLIFFFSMTLIVSCHRRTQNENSKPRKFEQAVSPGSVGFSSERLKRIDALLQLDVDNGTLPQAVTFIARHGKIVHYNAYGWKDIDNEIPVSTADIFRNASQSKAITTVT